MSQSLEPFYLYSCSSLLNHSISIHVPVSSTRHFTEPFCPYSCPSLFRSSLHWTILSLFMSQSLPLVTSLNHSVSIHVPVSSTCHFTGPFCPYSCPSLFCSSLHWTILSLHVPVSSAHHFIEPFYLCSCPSLFHLSLHRIILSLFLSQSLPFATSLRHSVSVHVPVSSTRHFTEPFYLYSCPSLLNHSISFHVPVS